MSVYNYLKLFVDYACPQCKASIPCVETDRLIRCRECNSIWHVCESHPVYYIPVHTRETDRVIYVPYWHHRGYYFAINNQSIDYHWIDQTIAALADPNLPFSLHQSILKERILPYTGNQQGRFVDPRISEEGCLNKGINMLDGVGLISKTIYEAPARLERKKINLLSASWKEITGKEEKQPVRKYEEADLINQVSTMNFHQLTSKDVYSKNNPSQQWIQVSQALVFYPFIMRGETFLNGLTQQAMKPPVQILKQPEYRSQDPIRLKKVVCPSCKEPVDLLENTEVLDCSSCKKSWIVYGNQLAGCGIGIHKSNLQDAIYLPFWKVSVKSNGVDRYKNQDKIWCFNLDRDSHQNGHISLWIPAFELPAAHLVRVASFLSRIDPSFPLEKTDFRIEKTKNNIALNSAVQIASVLVLDMARKDGSYYATLGDFQLVPQKALFVYLPFSKQGMDLIQPDTNLCIQSPPFLYKQED